MKKSKIKILTVGLLSTLIATSTATSAMAITAGSDSKVNNSIGEQKLYQAPYVKSLSILGYSDSLHYTRSTGTINDLYGRSTLNDVFYWAQDGSATVYLGTRQIGYGAGRPGTFLDGADINYNDGYRHVLVDSSNEVAGYLDVREFYNVPQGRHTMKFVIVNPAWNAPVSVVTDSINLRVNKLSAYVVNDPLSANVELTYTMPKQVAANVNLANYVGVIDTNSGNLVVTSVKLAADKQTILIDSATGQFPSDSGYELIINPGIAFADGTESYEGTIVDFTTKEVTTPPTTSGSAVTLATDNKRALKAIKQDAESIDIDASNPLDTKKLEVNSGIDKDAALKNINKLQHKAQK